MPWMGITSAIRREMVVVNGSVQLRNRTKLAAQMNKETWLIALTLVKDAVLVSAFMKTRARLNHKSGLSDTESTLHLLRVAARSTYFLLSSVWRIVWRIISSPFLPLITMGTTRARLDSKRIFFCW
jgi:hypothetical protein